MFYFKTDHDAPRGRVIAIDITQAAPADQLEGDRPRGARRRSQASTSSATSFVAKYLTRRPQRGQGLRPRRQARARVELPGIGTGRGFGGKRDDTETFYAFTVFTTPGAIYRYDLKTGESTVFRQPKVEFDPARLRDEPGLLPEQGRHQGPDVHRPQGPEARRQQPDLLYGYGGFNISLTPGFSARPTSPGWRWAASTRWPNLRGGGEYGEDVAPGRHQAAQAERVRRLHRRRRVADREQVHVAARARHQRRQQRRPAGRRGDDPAARPVRRGAAGRRRDGHAALPQVHDRLGLDRRLRLAPTTPRSSRRCYAYSPLPQRQAGHEVPADAGHDRRPRRPRGALRTASSSPPPCRRPRPATRRC